MPLSAYMSPHSQDALEDLGDALSDLEKKLCQHFRRLEIAGKRGRKVPVLLTPAMQEALDLLVSKREMCGVVPGNKYLFARPKACSYFRGSDCLRHFAKMCGAKNPESLTSTKLRKQTATLSQVLHLSNTELDQLADFLGHDVRVHRQFYRLTEGTLQLAKVSKILMALEQGRMAEFKGKGLDDITIDPEDHALQDSEDEDENQNIEEDLDAEMPDETNETSQPVTIETSSHPSLQAVQRPSRKGPSRTPTSARRTVVKRTWNPREVKAVEKHLMHFINSCRVPGKADCDKCLRLEKVALKRRDWRPHSPRHPSTRPPMSKRTQKGSERTQTKATRDTSEEPQGTTTRPRERPGPPSTPRTPSQPNHRANCTCPPGPAPLRHPSPL
ncbi:hypothetical protein WMY93_023248 [Mugilogobius chulae]|uniref:Uncharacterized protein n=1 Tax=Mugilogobius chulae TaxID=88201 RepID=A0AAW0NET4_9GOBI